VVIAGEEIVRLFILYVSQDDCVRYFDIFIEDKTGLESIEINSTTPGGALIEYRLVEVHAVAVRRFRKLEGNGSHTGIIFK